MKLSRSSLLTLISLIFVSFNLGGCIGSTNTQAPLIVGAASSLKPVIQDFSSIFEEEHNGTQVIIASGSSGSLAEQIKNGAPYDLFISANHQYTDRLLNEGILAPNTSVTLARGKLAIASQSVTKSSSINSILSEPSVSYIGVANPELAPYGTSAIRFMKEEGILDAIESKLIYTENAAQTLQLVLSKNAELGFVPQSLLQSHGAQKFSVIHELPEKYNSKLVVTAGAIVRENSHPMAREYLDMLSDAQFKDVWEKFEYELLLN